MLLSSLSTFYNYLFKSIAFVAFDQLKNEKLTKVAEKFVPPTALSKLKIFQFKKYFHLNIG